jgi:chaperonin GroES
MKAKDLKPINGQVLVVDDQKEEKTKSGIYIPDNTAPERVITGMVLAVSKEKDKEGREIEPEIAEGDKVFYSFHAGAGSGFKGEDDKLYRVIRQSEILAKIEEK